MMTAMERSISPYEERGSEVNMADSLGIKDVVYFSFNACNAGSVIGASSGLAFTRK